ncbi:unnamed protein product [Microthlaspi erraticum]|uniref:DUF3741 domain-containing protein n=1 Tax=Microthlaspi erraticum TaxID=1685480 RepID=A0A6D2LJU1_9BRAS|nr:unnamed protein product [Microthlaspi erraticum]
MKKSKKRENLLSPSSSWRENHNPPRRSPNSSAVSSGCIPGFFNLFLSTFNFSSNRRKSITWGSKKQEQRTVVYASPPKDSSNGVCGGGTVAPPLPRNEGEGDAARVSLVGALEKCDRDLEELRRTIDVIKTSYLLHKKLEDSQATARDNLKFPGTVTGDVVVGAQTQKNTKTTIHETETDTMLSMMNQQDQYYKDNKTYKVNNINLITRPDHYAMHDVISKRTTSTTTTETRATLPMRRVRRSLSLMESVNQVCDDVASGQRREVAKIGLALHDHICRDLIAETVREFAFSGYDYDDDDESSKLSAADSKVCYGGRSGGRHIRRGSTNSLPLDVCRRRLVF